MHTTRPIPELQELLRKKQTPLSQKLQYALEIYIAKLPEDEQPKARQQLHFLVQFGPIIIRYRKDFGLLQRINPEIPNGGLTEYHKHEIYSRFPSEKTITHRDILDTEFPGHDHMDLLLAKSSVLFPCMLKANVGERGVGIHYIANKQQRDALMEKYETTPTLWVPSTLQTYCDRPEERCLQFYQHPTKGINIGSLVKRNIPFVIGDGEHTVEELIGRLPLSPEQYEKITSTIQIEEPDLLRSIPKKDDRIGVVRKASIDFGTTYTDYTASLSEQHEDLHQVVKELLKDLPLLSVGRFDLKAHSLEGLLQGELRIIECNAGGGIPTQVYDESLSIKQKYTILDDHFDRMKQIGLLHKQVRRGKGTNLRIYREIIKVSRRSFQKKGIHLSKKKGVMNKSIIQVYKELFQLIKSA